MKVLNCSKCGSFAVTMNGTSCISIRGGKLCNGKIGHIEIKRDAQLEVLYDENDTYDFQKLVRTLKRSGWTLKENTTTKDRNGDSISIIILTKEAT